MSTKIQYRGPDGILYDSTNAMYAANPGYEERAIGQAVDPWGDSGGRGKAVSTLQNYIPTSKDPSNIYRTRLQQMMTKGFNPDDPSYKWRFAQGQQATERSLAARGLLDSGNALTELTAYGQGMASTEYQNQFQRLIAGMTGVEAQYSSQMDRLMKLAGVQDPTMAWDIRMRGQQIGLQGQQQAWNQDVAANQDRGVGDVIGKLQEDFYGTSHDYDFSNPDMSGGSDVASAGNYYSRPQRYGDPSGYVSGSESGMIEQWG